MSKFEVIYKVVIYSDNNTYRISNVNTVTMTTSNNLDTIDGLDEGEYNSGQWAKPTTNNFTLVLELISNGTELLRDLMLRGKGFTIEVSKTINDNSIMETYHDCYIESSSIEYNLTNKPLLKFTGVFLRYDMEYIDANNERHEINDIGKGQTLVDLTDWS